MTNRIVRSFGTMLLASSCLAFPVTAFAQAAAGGNLSPQEAPSQANVAAEGDIIVTASRRAENLRDVPMSVDVATGEQLQKLNLLDVKDVQRLSPGLQLSNTSGRNNTATLRGVTFDPDQGTSPSVDLYVNEVPIDPQVAFAAVYDVDQIEVLRGPQGALRGRTAPAGAITIRTRRPDLNDVNGYAQGTVTDRHAYNVQTAVSLPIVPGSLAIRAALLVDGNRLNQVYDVNNGQRSRSRTMSGRLSLRWEPTSDVQVNLSYQYLHYDNLFNQQVMGPGNAPAAGSPALSGPAIAASDYEAVAEGSRRFQNTTHFITGSVNWDLGKVTLSAIGGYQYSKLTQAYDQDAGNAIPGYINTSTVISPYKVLSGELRLASNNSGIWNWTVSGFYNHHTGFNTQTQQSDTFFTNAPIQAGLYLPIDLYLGIPIDDRTMSLAASSRFEFSPALTLELGARYTDEKNKQFADATVTSPGFAGVPGVPIPPVPPIPSRTSPLVPANLAVGHGKALTGGATLTYKVSPDVTTYVAYGRSYRLGSAGVGVPQNLSADLARSKDEHSDAVEIGIKADLLDRKVSLNLSAFYQKYQGYLVRIPYIYYDYGLRGANGVPSGPPDGTVDGVFPSGFNYNGNATVKGVEATVNARPTPNWDLMVGAAYDHGRFNNAKLPCNDFNGSGTPNTIGSPSITGSGNVSYCQINGRLAEIPDFNLTTSTELRFPMGSVTPYVGALFTYRPSFNFWRTASHYQSLEQLNLYLGVRSAGDTWEIGGFVKNALNQKRVTSVLGPAVIPTARSGVVYDSGYTLINATLPREIGATLTYHF